MAERITDKLVKALKAPESGNRIVYDTDIKGFGARITAKGVVSFVLNYRVDGRERRATIGQYDAWSVAAAREEAKVLKRQVDRGEDPMGDPDAPTVAELVERYRSDHLPKKRPMSRRDDEAMLAKIVVPRLGKQRVAEVRFRDIDSIHRAMKETPVRANRTIALCSKLFSLAVKWDMRPDNPCRGIEKYPEEGRQRYLTPPEISRLTEALANAHNPMAANIVRWLLLTGCRSAEAFKLTWNQLDTEQGVWVKPSSHTKQKRIHRLPLSAPALQLLSTLPQTSENVFAGEDGKSVTTIKKSWDTIRRAAGLEDVRVNDLRHAHASILASSGASLPVIGALLGHTQPSTTARYSHLMDDPLRQAVETVGAVVTGAEKVDVLPIKKETAD